jgi:hypothetical protein
MGKKKNTPKAGGASLPALKLGSRVRCTDDGVEGRITWANAVAVKIKWDDGEEITWKRDSLASRPIEILDADAEADQQAEPPQVLQMPERADSPEPAPEQPDATTTAAEAPPPAADQPKDQSPAATNAVVVVAETVPAKPKRQRKAPAEPREKKPSALDAAARVLAEAGQPMTCKEMIGAMAAKGYWSSPGGKTPDATLCSAILREIKVKGEQSRFVKTAPGRFASRPTV